MSFEEFYETWWLEHQNNVLAPIPKEAMRKAWLAGRMAEKASQQSVQADVAEDRPLCTVCNGYHYPPPREGHFKPQRC
jgi:hypothetical protein